MEINVFERDEFGRPSKVEMVSENIDEAHILAAIHVELLDTMRDGQTVFSRSFSGLLGYRDESEKGIPNRITVEIS